MSGFSILNGLITTCLKKFFLISFSYMFFSSGTQKTFILDCLIIVIEMMGFLAFSFFNCFNLYGF